MRHEREETEAWYEQVYSDQWLITSVDQQGRILSSSSEPGVMAWMLDALEVVPGMRVLEIGAGTGYNAALLAVLSGNPSLITTVDIDPLVVAQARQAIHQTVGEGATVVQGDGREGYECSAPYDRIIATASASTVPQAWLEQLSEDGILLCVIQPPSAPMGGLLKAYKRGSELHGTLIAAVSFMPLRDNTGLYSSKRAAKIDKHAPLQTTFLIDRTVFDPGLLCHQVDWAFFFFHSLPGIKFLKRGDALIYTTDAGTYIVFSATEDDAQLHVELRGEPANSLWQELVNSYALWVSSGRPAITCCQFTMNAAGQHLTIMTEDELLLTR